MAQELISTTMSTATPPAGFLHPVVGYDSSPPASRALDAAGRLLQGRTGRIDVVYVAYLSSLAMLSPGAIAQMESDFDQIKQELAAAAAEHLRGSGATWELGRRQGIITDQLIAVATDIRDAHPRSFHRLVKWRTGCEGRISYLKRCHGWDRTRLDGRHGAAIWCGHGVFAHNLTKIATLAS
jgi:hypothetical protein